jgi:hypothetical protein
MTQIAQSVVREIAATAPRLAVRISHALTRAAATRYGEERARIERTGFGGMI